MQRYVVLFSVVTCFALVSSACAPASLTPAPIPTSEAPAWQKDLDEYLTRLSNIGFSGSVLVAQKGEIVLSQGYGVPNKQGMENHGRQMKMGPSK